MFPFLLWAVVSAMAGNIFCLATTSSWCWPVWAASLVSLAFGWYFVQTLPLVMTMCLNLSIFALAQPVRDRPTKKIKKRKKK